MGHRTELPRRQIAELCRPDDLYLAEIVEACRHVRPCLYSLSRRFTHTSRSTGSRSGRSPKDSIPPSRTPFLIGIAGSVAVGKSTTARVLREVLARSPERPDVALVTTDGFLWPLAELQRRGILERKGFPESYDQRALLRFVASVKSGIDEVHAPVYSHLTYDIVPGGRAPMREYVHVTPAEFETLMQRIAQGWSTGDPDLAASCFAPDVIYVEPPDLQRHSGRQAVWELSGGADPPPMSMTWHHLLFDERKQQGAGEYTFVGQRQYHGMVIVELDDGLVRRWREYQYANDLPWVEFVGDSAFTRSQVGQVS